MNIVTLNGWAEQELRSLVAALPPDIRQAAETVRVSLEDKPGRDPADHELVGDELGVFEGPTAMEETDPCQLPHIRIFLSNLWEWVDEDEQEFRDEVGTTYLHELGHYLGWDEEDVSNHGLA